MAPFPLLLSADVERDSLEYNTPIDFSRQMEAVEYAINDVQSVVETFLHRILPVRKTVQIVDYSKWRYLYGFDYSLGFLREYPLAKILNVIDSNGNDVTSEYQIPDVTEYKEHRIQRTSNIFSNVQITAYTGYRRKDQTLQDLQDLGSEYNDLDTLPTALPDDIRSVLTKLILHRLTLASTGQFGAGQKVMGAIDDVTLPSPDRDFENDALRQLMDYRSAF